MPEELVNDLRDPALDPSGAEPFGVELGVFEAPRGPAHHRVRIGLHGREVPGEATPRRLAF